MFIISQYYDTCVLFEMCLPLKTSLMLRNVELIGNSEFNIINYFSIDLIPSLTDNRLKGQLNGNPDL